MIRRKILLLLLWAVSNHLVLRSDAFEEAMEQVTENEKINTESDVLPWMIHHEEKQQPQQQQQQQQNSNRITVQLQPKPRIVGGTAEKNKKRFSYFVMPDKSWWGCAATLISREWLITAAHCADDFSSSSSSKSSSSMTMGAYIGTSRYDHGNREAVKFKKTVFFNRAQDVMIHPHYVPNTFEYDVALIHLQETISENDDDITPVRLDDGSLIPPSSPILLSSSSGLKFTAIGFGSVTDSFPYQYPEKLQRIDTLPLVDTATCQEKMGTQNRGITNDMFCAGGLAGQDACVGDSGGPLILASEDEEDADDVLVGIISWGRKVCAKEGYPGVYAKISHLYPWIASVLCNDELSREPVDPDLLDCSSVAATFPPTLSPQQQDDAGQTTPSPVPNTVVTWPTFPIDDAGQTTPSPVPNTVTWPTFTWPTFPPDPTTTVVPSSLTPPTMSSPSSATPTLGNDPTATPSTDPTTSPSPLPTTIRTSPTTMIPTTNNNNASSSLDSNSSSSLSSPPTATPTTSSIIESQEPTATNTSTPTLSSSLSPSSPSSFSPTSTGSPLPTNSTLNDETTETNGNVGTAGGEEQQDSIALNHRDTPSSSSSLRGLTNLFWWCSWIFWIWTFLSSSLSLSS